MRLLLIIPIILISLSVYFVFILDIFPEKYLNKNQLEPSPFFEIELSDSEINLGESFQFKINSKNIGDYGDIYIISVAFPTLETLDDKVRITHYDLSHSPLMIEIGDELGSNYTGGIETVQAKYPSIEAMNRPAPSDAEFHIDLLITPDKTEPFVIYVKNVAFPHISNDSHYPKKGVLDQQNEFVRKYTIEVNP